MTIGYPYVRALPAAPIVRVDWTPEDDARLFALRAEGKRVGEIATVMGRTFGSITARISRLEVIIPRAATPAEAAPGAGNLRRHVPSLAELVPLASLGQKAFSP